MPTADLSKTIKKPLRRTDADNFYITLLISSRVLRISPRIFINSPVQQSPLVVKKYSKNISVRFHSSGTNIDHTPDICQTLYHRLGGTVEKVQNYTIQDFCTDQGRLYRSQAMDSSSWFSRDMRSTTLSVSYHQAFIHPCTRKDYALIEKRIYGVTANAS